MFAHVRPTVTSAKCQRATATSDLSSSWACANSYGYSPIESCDHQHGKGDHTDDPISQRKTRITHSSPKYSAIQTVRCVAFVILQMVSMSNNHVRLYWVSYAVKRSISHVLVDTSPTSTLAHEKPESREMIRRNTRISPDCSEQMK